MHHHAMALGYFFLAVSCVGVSTLRVGVLEPVLLGGAVLALIAAANFLWQALSLSHAVRQTAAAAKDFAHRAQQLPES